MTERKDILKPKGAPTIIRKKIRMPDMDALAKQQEEFNQLAALGPWTQKPAEEAAAAIAAPEPAPVPKKKQPRPWEGVSKYDEQAYHIKIPKRLYKQLEWLWKQKDEESLRQYILKILDSEARFQLKDMGEEP